LTAYAPSGLDDFFGLPYLGLKPQALCLRPCGAGFETPSYSRQICQAEHDLETVILHGKLRTGDPSVKAPR